MSGSHRRQMVAWPVLTVFSFLSSMRFHKFKLHRLSNDTFLLDKLQGTKAGSVCMSCKVNII